jgi:hypothetical protein
MQVSTIKYAPPEQIENRLSFAGKEKKQEAAKQNYTMYKDHFVRNTAIVAGTGAVIAGIATRKPLFALVGAIGFAMPYFGVKTIVDHFRREGKGENDHLGKNLLIATGIGAVIGALAGKRMIGKPLAQLKTVITQAPKEGVEELEEIVLKSMENVLESFIKHSRAIAATSMGIGTAQLYLQAKTPYDQITKK